MADSSVSVSNLRNLWGNTTSTPSASASASASTPRESMLRSSNFQESQKTLAAQFEGKRQPGTTEKKKQKASLPTPGKIDQTKVQRLEEIKQQFENAGTNFSRRPKGAISERPPVIDITKETPGSSSAATSGTSRFASSTSLRSTSSARRNADSNVATSNSYCTKLLGLAAGVCAVALIVGLISKQYGVPSVNNLFQYGRV